jgi:tetratricopeptide (TPR) repeat protein
VTSSSRLTAWVIIAAAMIAALAVYYPALDGAFISDDKALVLSNPAIRSIERSLAAFKGSYWEGLKDVAPYYRPLPLISYAINYSLAGKNPFSYHWTNLLLHGLNAGLAGLLVLGLVGSERHAPGSPTSFPWPVALAVGLLVAVHPLHSEPVAAVYGRPHQMAGFFSLLFLNLAVRGRLLLAVVALAGALLSKEAALGLPLLAPFALAAGRRAVRRTTPGKGREAEWVGPSPFWSMVMPAAVLGGYLFLRFDALGGWFDSTAVTRLDNPLVEAGAAGRLSGGISVLGRYAALWTWPSALCADRGFMATPLPDSLMDPTVILGASILVAGLALLIVLGWKGSSMALPLAAAGLVYLPASNLILLAPAQMAERFVYLPSVFLLVFAGSWIARSRQVSAEEVAGPPGWPFGKNLLLGAAIVLVIAGGARTFVRAGEFETDLNFYQSGAASCPDSAKSQFNFGNALMERGRDDEAIVAFRKAVEIAPWLAVAENNMGHAYLNLRRLEDAEDAFREAIRQEPKLLQPRLSLAGILYMRGKLGRALIETRAALGLNPTAQEKATLLEMEKSITERLGSAREESP